MKTTYTVNFYNKDRKSENAGILFNNILHFSFLPDIQQANVENNRSDVADVLYEVFDSRTVSGI